MAVARRLKGWQGFLLGVYLTYWILGIRSIALIYSACLILATTLLFVFRRKPILKNRADPAIEQAVVDIALEYQAYWQLRISKKQHLIVISCMAVRSR
jgi:hypothetical protein